MKKNLLLPITATVFALATTGCLEKKEETNQASNRDALIAALDKQAVGLVESINNVVISGNFLANLNLENPPQPIPLDGDADVKKAIDYLFANEVADGANSTYTPDSRICSEILAKNNPSNCEKVFEKISFSQQVSDEDTGYVQVSIDGVQPFGFVYDRTLVSLSVSLPGLFSAIEKIKEIEAANGGQPGQQDLPSTRNGTVTLTVANQMGASIVDLTVSQAIEIAGVTSQGKNYAVNIPAVNNLATATLISSLGIGTVSINAPAFSALIPVHDHNEVQHSVAFTFPGLTGQASLNNAAAMIEASSIQLLAASVSATVDGQPAFQVDVAAPLNAQVVASAGDLNLTFTSAFSAMLQVSTNPLVDKAGSVSASIAQDTSLLFEKDSEQAKLLNGSFSLIGSGDFSVNLDAQAGMCIQGSDEAFDLQTVVCQ